MDWKGILAIGLLIAISAVVVVIWRLQAAKVKAKDDELAKLQQDGRVAKLEKDEVQANAEVKKDSDDEALGRFVRRGPPRHE